jgi:hypothetical protein
VIAVVRPSTFLLEIIDARSYRGSAISTAISTPFLISLEANPTGSQSHRGQNQCRQSSSVLASWLVIDSWVAHTSTSGAESIALSVGGYESSSPASGTSSSGGVCGFETAIPSVEDMMDTDGGAKITYTKSMRDKRTPKFLNHGPTFWRLVDTG